MAESVPVKRSSAPAGAGQVETAGRELVGLVALVVRLVAALCCLWRLVYAN
jgi:hypothetical protein